MKPKLLTFSTLYPNACQPRHGIFVEERLRHLVGTGDVQAKVVAPVPWFPSSRAVFGQYGLYARVPQEETRRNIEVMHPRYPVIPKVGMRLAPMLLATSLYRFLRGRIRDGYDFDLIDAHYLYPDGVAAVRLGQKLGKPVVLTARGTDVNLIPDYPGPRRQIINACRQAQSVITVSEALREALIKLGVSKDKVVTLRNGVDLEAFKPQDKSAAKRALEVEGPVWLSVGHLIESKGHHLAIEAAAKVPEVTLVIVGDGPEQTALHALVRRLGVSDRVRFAGHEDHGSLPRYYSAADTLILASSREGMPNVALESMACGTPVIATAIGGTPEIVTVPEAGELMESRSADSIVHAWARLRSRPGSVEATRRHALEFGWEPTVRAQLTLYRSVVT